MATDATTALGRFYHLLAKLTFSLALYENNQRPGAVFKLKIHKVRLQPGL